MSDFFEVAPLLFFLGEVHSPFLSLMKEKEAKENQGVRDARQVYQVRTISAQQLNNPTIQQLNNPTTQQSNNSTIQQLNNPTTQQPHQTVISILRPSTAATTLS